MSERLLTIAAADVLAHCDTNDDEDDEIEKSEFTTSAGFDSVTSRC